MSNIKGYGIVNGAHTDADAAQKQLIDSVLGRMKQGWIPQGGVALAVVVSGDEYVHIYSQAIVLPADANLWQALQEPETELPE